MTKRTHNGIFFSEAFFLKSCKAHVRGFSADSKRDITWNFFSEKHKLLIRGSAMEGTEEEKKKQLKKHPGVRAYVLACDKMMCKKICTGKKSLPQVSTSATVTRHQGRMQGGFEGVDQVQLGVWWGVGGGGGAVSPPAGSGVEPRKILKLTLFRG